MLASLWLKREGDMQDFRPPFSSGVRPPRRKSPKVAIWGPSPSIGFSGTVRLLADLSVPGALVPAHKFHPDEIHKLNTTGAKSFKAPKSLLPNCSKSSGELVSQAMFPCPEETANCEGVDAYRASPEPSCAGDTIRTL